jgi:hypothetical protein
MANNSTNINKTNNRLLPQIIEHKKKNMTCEVENGLEQDKNKLKKNLMHIL